jgi:hypothetical protein
MCCIGHLGICNNSSRNLFGQFIHGSSIFVDNVLDCRSRWIAQTEHPKQNGQFSWYAACRCKQNPLTSLKVKGGKIVFIHTFTSQAGEDGIEVRVVDENVWLTQKLIAKLFDVGVNTINYHLKEIYKSQEPEEAATIRNFRIVQNEGSREVQREVDHYNLEAIISTGFRVNSERATNFRRWATQVLKDYTLRGYVLDDIRLKNGAYLSKQYFRDLILEIRDIRESERNFYQQITDIYAMAIDYDLHSPTTKTFFRQSRTKCIMRAMAKRLRK